MKGHGSFSDPTEVAKTLICRASPATTCAGGESYGDGVVREVTFDLNVVK
ncbi:hypothetical protein [Rhizobium bangladeshense]|nr:hypothetical protein [Rhizobium bangladeshense]